MERVLYDLCAADDQRFSPYCLRTKLALAHKGLDYATEPVRFTEKHKLAFSGQDRVPILDDGGTVVHDSWAIAEYLEDAYADGPALFPGTHGWHLAKMTNEWTDRLHLQLLSCIVFDICQRLEPEDQAYFRPSREARFGDTLEAVQARRDETVIEFREVTLASMRGHLLDRLYISGRTPAYSDFIVFGTFQWARLTSDFDLLDPADPIYDWRSRMIDHAGY